MAPKVQAPNEPETSIIDMLFLELSQFTRAKSARELELELIIGQWQTYASYLKSCARSGESDVQDFDTFIKMWMESQRAR